MIDRFPTQPKCIVSIDGIIILSGSWQPESIFSESSGDNNEDPQHSHERQLVAKPTKFLESICWRIDRGKHIETKRIVLYRVDDANTLNYWLVN